MAARPKLRRSEAQLGFEALSIEGGLLSPDWLSRAAQLQAGQQSEADYRVPKGLNLRDEIGRYWRIAQAHWTEFAAGRASGGDARALAERFVPSLLRESFGFISLAEVEPVVIAERSYPVGFSTFGLRVPVVIAPAGSGLDSLAPVLGVGWSDASNPPRQREPHAASVDGSRPRANLCGGALRGFRRTLAPRA
jgi:hypothetical protein